MGSKRKRLAVHQARTSVEQKPVYLDTETTGLGLDAQIVNLALISHDGTVLLDTLIKPTIPIGSGAEDIHGISNEAVADAPSFNEVLADLVRLTEGRLVLIYNADFDLRLLRQSAAACQVELPAMEAGCVMKAYAQFHGDWNDYRGNYKWQSQAKAARQLNLDVPDNLHRAAADAQLCRRIVEAMAVTRLPGEEK